MAAKFEVFVHVFLRLILSIFIRDFVTVNVMWFDPHCE